MCWNRKKVLTGWNTGWGFNLPWSFFEQFPLPKINFWGSSKNPFFPPLLVYVLEKQFLTRRNTRWGCNLPCYQRQTATIDSNNRCATRRTNEMNKQTIYYQKTKQGEQINFKQQLITKIKVLIAITNKTGKWNKQFITKNKSINSLIGKKMNFKK